MYAYLVNYLNVALHIFRKKGCQSFFLYTSMLKFEPFWPQYYPKSDGINNILFTLSEDAK